MNEIEKVYGLIAYIDALGVSSYTIDQSEEFILKIRRFMENYVKERFTKENLIRTGHITENMDPPKLYTFADTIVFSWKIEKTRIPDIFYIVATTEFLKDIIYWFSFEPWISFKDNKLSLKNIVPLRGALSIGDYVISSSNAIILGPAVFDVALWYEKADWYGIITTPNCQKIFEQSIKNRQIVKKMSKKFDEPVYLKGHFVKYPVPLKGGKTENLWVVSWPYQVIEEFEKKEKKGVTRDLVYNNFLPSENAKIERKRYNTNKFFNWYLDNIYDNVKQYEDKAREYLDSL